MDGLIRNLLIPARFPNAPLLPCAKGAKGPYWHTERRHLTVLHIKQALYSVRTDDSGKRTSTSQFDQSHMVNLRNDRLVHND